VVYYIGGRARGTGFYDPELGRFRDTRGKPASMERHLSYDKDHFEIFGQKGGEKDS